jgi:hypothetical protein
MERGWLPGPPEGPGGEHWFTWWATTWFTACAAAAMVAFGAALLWLLSSGWPTALLALPLGAVAAYGVADVGTIVCPVAVRDRGFWVRVLTRWVEIRWDNVERMRYLRWHVMHVIHLRRQPAGRFFPGAFTSQMGLVVVLPLGLHRRSDLFWTIWHRASRAQGHEVPVIGAISPIEPPGS